MLPWWTVFFKNIKKILRPLTYIYTKYKQNLNKYLNVETDLEDLWQLPEPGALGQQKWWRALTSDRIQVQFEPDGADLRNGWTNVLEDTHQTHNIKLLYDAWPTRNQQLLVTKHVMRNKVTPNAHRNFSPRPNAALICKRHLNSM